MIRSEDIREIAAACSSIGDEVADGSGFVSMRALLDRFGASLLIRPLLVEGMLAAMEARDDRGNKQTKWAVLVDLQTYDVDYHDIASESQDRPLPVRLRNTITHELLHSLALRTSEFGLRLNLRTARGKKPSDLVAKIERFTEGLSPILLWPDAAVQQLLSDRREAVSSQVLETARQRLGISRPVLINRLRHLGTFNQRELLHSPALTNLAVGRAEWLNDGTAVIRSWPLFTNFRGSQMPAFLRDIRRRDRIPAAEIFPSADSIMCGGADDWDDFLADAGTEANPCIEKRRVRLLVDAGSRKPGSPFMFSVCTIPD